MGTEIFGHFEWDDAKARSNEAKHGVSFEEAASVFLDLDDLLLGDPEHPDRFVALGYSGASRLLFVVHCERVERLRTISAPGVAQRASEL